MVRSSINHSRFIPGLVMHPYLDAERDWILIHQNNANLAVCSVYMAADTGGGDHIVWNENLYSMIQSEMTVLQGEGYSCVLAGDFNGHIGDDEGGVEGNLQDVNHNGRLVRDFIFPNGLSIVIADRERCEGVFTRVGANSVSLLDLVLEDKLIVQSLVVDEECKLLGGSNHAPLIFTINIGKEQSEPPVVMCQTQQNSMKASSNTNLNL